MAVAARQGPPTAGTVLRYVASRVAAGRWEVPGIGPLLLAAHAVLGDYPVIGLAGAMNVVLAREFRTNVIATLDQGHFRVIPHSPPTALSACCQPTYPRAFPDAAPCGDRSLVSAQAEQVRFGAVTLIDEDPQRPRLVQGTQGSLHAEMIRKLNER